MAANLIFDLDGTLADSWPAVFEVVNDMELLSRELSPKDYERLKNMPVKKILKELNIPIWRTPRLLIRGHAALAHHIAEIPSFRGVPEVIHQLNTSDNQLFVLSSNSHSNVARLLNAYGIEKSFVHIYGGAGIFSKASALKKIIKDHNLDKAKTYYVGDEVRDIEAAKRAGIHSIAVTWGFNGEKILREYKPDHVVHTPAALRKLFAGGKK